MWVGLKGFARVFKLRLEEEERETMSCGSCGVKEETIGVLGSV